MGHGGVKTLGTVAIAILLAFEKDDLDVLCKYVRQKTWDSPEGLDKRRVLELVKILLNESGDSIPIVEPVWYVDKIVDPEVSQPPGKKLSDKNKPKGKRGRA